MQEVSLLDYLMGFAQWSIIFSARLLVAMIINCSLMIIVTWSIHFALLPFGINTKYLGSPKEYFETKLTKWLNLKR